MSPQRAIVAASCWGPGKRCTECEPLPDPVVYVPTFTSFPIREEITVSDFLDDRRKEITDRLEELRPLVDEFNRLEAAAVALAEAVGSTVGSAASAAGSTVAAIVTRRRGPGRPRGSATGKKGPGRPRGSASRGASKATPTAAAETATVAPKKGPGRPKGSGKKVGRPKGKVGRRKGSGTRSAQALRIVQGQPGMSYTQMLWMGLRTKAAYLPG
jgi:hypothetical protein